MHTHAYDLYLRMAMTSGSLTDLGTAVELMRAHERTILRLTLVSMAFKVGSSELPLNYCLHLPPSPASSPGL